MECRRNFPKSLCGQPSVRTVLIVTAAVCVAVGFLGGLLLDAEVITSRHIRSAARLQLVFPKRAHQSAYTVLDGKVWHRTPWGSNCTEDTRVDKGLQLLCQLPEVWKDCSNGIYLDVGTNVGVQLRKLYTPWQFPGALVLDLFTNTYGHERSKVCALGIEANPTHTAYLTVLNAYFKRKGYQALVLTETAASIKPGEATFHQDPGLTHELGASLSSDKYYRQTKQVNTAVTVSLFDLPAFMSEIIKPLVLQVQWETGQQPPVGMKMDVEGEEYALLPGLITSGGLCDLNMIYLEPHAKSFRSDAGKAVGMLLPAVEKTFEQMCKANPRCIVNYTHLDDETYLHADTDVPLAP